MGGFGQLALAREAMIPLAGQSPLPAMGQALNLAGLLQNQNEQRQLFPGQMQLQQQRIQGNQMALDQAQQEQRDNQVLQGALQQSGGDMGKALGLVYGKVSPNSFLNWQAQHVKVQDTLSEMDEREFKTQQDRHNRLAGLYSAAMSMPDDQYAQSWPAIKNAAAAIDPSMQLPDQPVPKQQLQALGLAFMTQDQYLKAEDAKRQQDQLQETIRHNKATEGKPNVEQAEMADYVARTGKGPADFAAWKAGLSRDPNAAADRQFREGQQSYQYSSGALDKVGQPIEQLVQRMGRLQDTLAQANPQADALVAPELLTVMAGGMGSGLRMNEAEISRIVGGRNKWESLKSAIDQWQSDPSKPFLITPAQRGQIGALLNEVNSKLQAKQQILDDARQDLSSSNDPMQHRQILTRARNRLMQVDQGQGGGGGLSSAAQAFISKYSK